jgi:hypothetical protein
MKEQPACLRESGRLLAQAFAANFFCRHTLTAIP